MHDNLQKEQFSNAYLRAVAATAGFQVYKPEPDLDKSDWGIAAPGPRSTYRSPRVEVQLKSTAQDVLRDEHLAYPVDMETYENLRDPNLMVPKILVVVVVPAVADDWIDQSEERMLLRHCGYWVSLRNRPTLSNTSTTTVDIPRVQQFTVQALVDMMERIGSGGVP